MEDTPPSIASVTTWRLIFSSPNAHKEKKMETKILNDNWTAVVHSADEMEIIVSDEVRAHMSAMAKRRWEKVSPEERSEYARKMLRARAEKREAKKS